jgi:DNA-binding response OmpR family regulator
MPKLLVVDDDELIRLLYSEELNEAAYEVITAESGYKILEKIEAEKPDLVILEIKMTDSDGLDILQDIRNHFYKLPIIVSTVYESCKKDKRSVAADFYVLKSFDLTELKEKIGIALEDRLPYGNPLCRTSSLCRNEDKVDNDSSKRGMKNENSKFIRSAAQMHA